MEVRLIARPLKTSKASPQLEAVRFARENGFELRREPFGRRGSLIEIYRNGEDLGYRKSYGAALNLMRKHAAAKSDSPSLETTMDTSAQTPDTPAIKAQARFSADHLRWVFAARANIFDPRTHLQKILIEPAPEGGVYIVASNAALLMVAYDAKGSASHRFTFDPLEEIAHICGFPDDGPDPFGRSSYADTIEIEGSTLTALLTRQPLSHFRAGALVKVLSQDVEIGEHFPPWQGLFTNLGTETAFTGFVDLQQLAIAFTGIPSGPMAISVTQHARGGDDATEQPTLISFERLPLRAALMPMAAAPGEPRLTRCAMPFDA